MQFPGVTKLGCRKGALAWASAAVRAAGRTFIWSKPVCRIAESKNLAGRQSGLRRFIFLFLATGEHTSGDESGLRGMQAAKFGHTYRI